MQRTKKASIKRTKPPVTVNLLKRTKVIAGVSLKKQIESHVKTPESITYTGNCKTMISTGCTLLDLAIAGRVKKGGGIPGGILLEVFGPEGSGKTVLLCEIGGAIQRMGGDVLFNDPEARLNKAFASVNGLDINNITIEEPDTVTEVFNTIRNWKPKKSKVSGIMTDSLAALSTNIEMDSEDGDKMGMRRAKEFSEGLRKVCRILKQNNYIMACSNQIRVNAGAQAFAEQFTVPGGKAIAFYSSVRLRFHKPEKIKKERIIRGVKVKDVIGTKVKVEVYKNSIDRPYRTCDLYIDFKYGIDDIRGNLEYLKEFSKHKEYRIDEVVLDANLEKSIQIIEQERLEEDLKAAVMDLWEEIELSFETERKKKVRV